MIRARATGLGVLTLLLCLSFVGQAQQLTKEYVYVGGRLLAVDVPTPAGSSDLTVDALAASASGSAGGSVNVQLSIRNSGAATGDANATSVKFYFSSDSTITTADPVSTTEYPVDGGFLGQVGPVAVNVQIPSGLPGTVYLGAFIDADDDVIESDDGNNILLATTGGTPGGAFTVTPSTGGSDPVLVSLSPASGSGGQQQFTGVFQDADGLSTLNDVRLLIGNSGTDGCYLKYDHAIGVFYIRNNANTSWLALTQGEVANDRCVLDSTSTASEVANELLVTWEVSFTSDIASASAKTRTLQAWDGPVLAASSNFGTWTVPVPNVTFSNMVVPVSGVALANIPMEVEVTSSSAQVGSLTVEFHQTDQSTGGAPTPSPTTRLGSCTVTVPADGTAPCIGTGSFDASGDYRVWPIFVDKANVNEVSATLSESDDITIAVPNGSPDNPDLTLSSVFVTPGSVAIGGYGYFTVQAINIQAFAGFNVNSSFTIGLYFSTDSQITTSDIKVGECVHAAMGSAAQGYTCRDVFFQPTGLTAGIDYYYGAIVDINNDIVESNENNQLSYGLSTITYGSGSDGPAISPWFYALPAEASPGDTIINGLAVANMHPGNEPANGPFVGRTYISETGDTSTGWNTQLGTCTNWFEPTLLDIPGGGTTSTSCDVYVAIPTLNPVTEHFMVFEFEYANDIDDLFKPVVTSKPIDIVMAPVIESVVPASGTGRNQLFTLNYSDGNLASDIDSVEWLLNGSLIYNGACAILYQQGPNNLFLIDDDGADWGTPITPGSGTLSNSTCSIDGTGVFVTAIGTDLEIVLSVSFDYGLGSDQTQWMKALDLDSKSSGWVQAGTWTISGVPSQAPTSDSVSPSSGEGTDQSFTMTYSDADGTVDIAMARVLFNSSTETANACFVEYLPGPNSVRLMNDGATAWSASAVLGSATVLQNTQCEINLANSSFTTVGIDLELTLDVTLTLALGGVQNVYLDAFDMSGYTAGWQQLGTWEVLSPYFYRRLLTVPANQIPHSNTLTDYPVLVSGTYADLKSVGNGGDVESANGYDIQFQSTEGVKLDHEVEKWSASTGELIAWVRLPVLDGSVANTFYMYYGNSAVVLPEANPDGVWSTDHSAVWHLNTNPYPQALDSTSNDKYAYPVVSGTAGTLTSGKIGNGVDFDGINDGLFVTGIGGSLSFGAQRTFSTWLDIDVFADVIDDYTWALFGNENGSCYSVIWSVGSKEQSTLAQRVGHGASGASPSDVESSSNLSLNNWIKLDVTSDGSHTRFYINGALDRTVSQSGTPAACSGSYAIGRESNGFQYFNGTIDEMRILTGTALSADRIATEYANQNTPASFVQFGAEEAGNVNFPPVLTNPGTQADTVGVITSLALSATDPESNPITYSATGLPPGLSINTTSGVISGTPTTIGSYSVTATVLAGGDTDVEVFSWGITANQAPTLTNPGVQSTLIGGVGSLQLVATDPESDPIAYSATGLPPGLTLNTTTGAITGTANTLGGYSVSATVLAIGGQDTEVFAWNVVVNQPPVLTNPGAQANSLNVPASLALSAADPETDPITYSATGLPPGLSVNATSGVVSGTPTTEGTYSVTATATATGGVHNQAFSWEISGLAPFEESNGRVVVEAESGDLIAGTTHDWDLLTSISGYSGSGYLASLPDSGTNQNSGYVGVSPRVQIPVSFTTTGTYYVWVLGSAPAGGDSVHVGLDGAAVSTSDRISFPVSSWVWRKDTMDSARASMVVSAAGTHTIDVWMREDGFRFDKILLTTDSNYTPSGTGPAESYRVGEAPATLLLADDFSGTLANWTVLDEGNINAPSNWHISSGLLVDDSNIYGGSTNPSVLPKPGTMILAGDTAWTDYVYRTRMRSSDNDAIGIVFRYQDSDNYYRFSMDTSRNYRRLVKNVNDSFTLLHSDTVSFTQSQWYDIEAHVSGDSISVYIDGELWTAVTDTAHASGKIGVYAWVTDPIEVDDVEVYVPQTLLTDDFSGTLANWTVVDQGTNNAPSNWAISNGVVRETSNIYGGDTSASALPKPGTMLVAGDSSWTDYTFTADMRTGDNDAIGIVFRYQDGDNYYRFSMDTSKSYRRLVKNVNGSFTELHGDSVSYTQNQWYELKADVSGDTLRIFIDGQLWTTVTDTAFADGKVGLYSYIDNDLDADDIEVVTNSGN